MNQNNITQERNSLIFTIDWSLFIQFIARRKSMQKPDIEFMQEMVRSKAQSQVRTVNP